MADLTKNERAGALTVWCPRCFVNPGVSCKSDCKKVVHALRVRNWRKTLA